MGPDVDGLPDSPGKPVGVSIQYLRIFKLDVVAWVILVDMYDTSEEEELGLLCSAKREQNQERAVKPHPREPICTNNDISQYTICERHHREDPESDQVVRDHNTRETCKETERYPM